MNIRFHSGAEDRYRPFSALQSKSCKCETTWPYFSWVCLLVESDNPLPEKWTIYPRILASLPATCTVLHPLTILALVTSHGVAALMSSDQICTFLSNRSYFDQLVTCTCFETFRAFQVFVGYFRNPFPPRGWKYSLTAVKNNHLA